MKFEREQSDDELDKDLSSDDDLLNDDDTLLNDDLGFDDYLGGDVQTPMQKHGDLLKQLTDFKPYIKEKVNGWLGLVWDEDTSKFVRHPEVQPIMNKKCAAWCIDYLKTYTRDNNIITNIGRREYEFLVMDIIEVVWLDIGTRMEEFDIKGNADLHRICVELQHAAELILMGAGDGKYNKLLQEATMRHENISSVNPNMMGQQQMAEHKKKNPLQRIKSLFTGS